MRLLDVYTVIWGWRVRGGPFDGMRYVRDSVCSALVPKLLGTYELELAGRVEQIISRHYPRMINIGAAEGYYAVGFALRCPSQRVIAFEGEAQGRALITELATLNGVDRRVVIEGTCTSESLSHQLRDGAALLIVDIEGGEVALLDPEKNPELRHCPMLVELHEDHQPAADILRARFSTSHHIEECWTRIRDVRDLPTRLRLVDRMLGGRLSRALDERRPGPMRWFWFEPRERPE